MIIFDLDGTLADCEHRRHFVEPRLNKNYEYANYHKKIDFEDDMDEAGNLKPRWRHKETGERFKPNWKDFFEACEADAPIIPTLIIFSRLLEDYNIQIWSGRSESVRQKTMDWFVVNWFVNSFKIQVEALNKALKMRPIGDYTPDEQLKEKWLDEALAAGKKIDFVFDDRPKVIEMWRRRGIFAFACNQTNWGK